MGGAVKAKAGIRPKSNAAALGCCFMPAPFLWMSLSDSAVSAKEQAEAISGFFPAWARHTQVIRHSDHSSVRCTLDRGMRTLIMSL